ncbi:MAG TPA: hypothetical protein VJQ07_04040, partial [Gaiellaceae bacterium]|nr:hypothetical protein [Gaiellaceae bacterium]
MKVWRGFNRDCTVRRSFLAGHLLAVAVAALVLLPSASAGGGVFSWSAPVLIDQHVPSGGRAMTAVACPSAIQCTAVDSTGQEVTFDPASPGTPVAVTIDSGGSFNSVSCPATSQCTAVDSAGEEVTFNPVSPGHPTPAMVDSGIALKGISCPSVSSCTAVGGGIEVTFNPVSPGAPAVVPIKSYYNEANLTGIACPSTSQCTAVGLGEEVTFDPASPATPTALLLDVNSSFDALDCPSTAQCTAVGSDIEGVEATFDPLTYSPGDATSVAIDTATEPLVGTACATTSQCVAVDEGGEESTFNPIS